MTGIIELLTTFSGRISRKQWWIGFVIVVLASVAGTLALDPDAFTADNPPPSWADTIWQLVMLYPGTAITVKRFNDRDWPWWLGYASALLTPLMILPPHFSLPVDPNVGGIGAFLFWFVMVALLLILVDNGFIRGTRGPNRYGPEPLAAPAARPA